MIILTDAIQPSSAAARALLVGGQTRRLLIGGEWVDAVAQERFTTIDPATGKTLAMIARARSANVDRAVAAARAALSWPWSRLVPAERAALLVRIADLIDTSPDYSPDGLFGGGERSLTL